MKFYIKGPSPIHFFVHLVLKSFCEQLNLSSTTYSTVTHKLICTKVLISVDEIIGQTINLFFTGSGQMRRKEDKSGPALYTYIRLFTCSEVI